MYEIELYDLKFPLREIEFDFGFRLISVVELNNIIMDDGRYTSEEARLVDEKIFYYVDNESIYLDEMILHDKIISEI